MFGTMLVGGTIMVYVFGNDETKAKMRNCASNLIWTAGRAGVSLGNSLLEGGKKIIATEQKRLHEDIPALIEDFNSQLIFFNMGLQDPDSEKNCQLYGVLERLCQDVIRLEGEGKFRLFSFKTQLLMIQNDLSIVYGTFTHSQRKSDEYLETKIQDMILAFHRMTNTVSELIEERYFEY